MRHLPHDASDRARTDRGAVLLVTFFMMLVVAGLAAAVGTLSHNSVMIGKSQLMDQQAFHVAEAGLARARQALAAGTWTVSSCPSGSPCVESFPPASPVGQYEVTITGSGPYTITSNGYLPNPTAWTMRRQASLSSVSTFTNLSRNANVIAVASSSEGTKTPDRAKDGDTGTAWRAGTAGNNSWLGMEFPLATTLDQVIVREDNNIEADGVTIEWSDDASSWTTVSGLSVSGSPGPTWTATFTPSTHRYCRAVFTNVKSGKKASVNELETSHAAGNALALSQGTFATQW